MRNLLASLIVTLSVLITNVIRKNKINPLIYIAIFAAVLMSCFFVDKIYGSQASFNCYLTPTQRDEYFELINYHYTESWHCSHESESYTTQIPSKFHKSASKAAIVAVSVGIVSRDIRSAAVAAVIASLEELIGDFGEIWENINHNMLLCKYHLEMAEFYQDLLFNDGA